MSKVALVTGSNKGIGLAIVRALCQKFTGDVYVSARDVGRGEAAMESLSKEGLNPGFIQLDVTDPTSIIAARNFFKEEYGGLDVLVNNAGIALNKPSERAPIGVQADLILKTNFFGTREVSNELLPIIKPGGRVVNLSSVLGSQALARCSADFQVRFRSDNITEEELVLMMRRFVADAQENRLRKGGWPNNPLGISKTGLTVLSRIQARRLSRERPGDGVLLNACCPGWVRTDMTEGQPATKSPDEGAITPVHLALLPPGTTQPHGELLADLTVQQF